jgi:dolichyl-phosphate-mannose-protein mannosyltransferase
MGMEIKGRLTRLYRWEYFWLCLIVLATLGIHFFMISNPSELILDEQHYVNDARVIIANHETMRTEHPPLAKLFIVAGEYIFSGFKSPEENAGTITQQVIASSDSTVIDVSDASKFSSGKAIIIDRELMTIENVDTSLNQITVKRAVGGTAETGHAAQQTIYVFNDNPWDWRVFPILFGTASIVLFYFLCRKLEMSRTGSSIATFLLAFENMTFMQNSVAMLDVFYVTFMIGSFLLYVNRKYITSGIAIGLSGLAKLSGALAGPVLAIHWIYPFIAAFFKYLYRRLFTSKITFGFSGLVRLMGMVYIRRGRSWWFLLTAFFAVLVFVELMIPLDYAISRSFHNLADPIHRIRSMLSLSGSLTFANVDHPSKAYPWEWLYTYKPMAYWIMPHYTAAISFTVWVLIIPAFGYMVYKAVRGSEAGLFGAAWFTGTFLLLALGTFITDRVTYIYYFYPTVGAVCIGMALGLNDLLSVFHRRPSGKLKWTALSVVIFILFLHLASFLILSPLIPVDFAKMVGITG